MKKIFLKRNLLLFRILIFGLPLAAQSQKINANALTLEEAIRISKNNNPTIAIFRLEESAADAEYQDAQSGRLPGFGAAAAYLRFSDVTFYENGLSSSNTLPKRPDSNVANAGIEGTFNLYSGGRQHAVIEESGYKKNLAVVNSREQTGNIGLQTAVQYLELVKLYQLRKLIAEQHKRSELRLKNITAFYNSQRITKNDLLRAEVALSNVSLSRIQNENDIMISCQKLAVLLNLENKNEIIIPADSIPVVDSKMPFIFDDIENPYALQKLDMNLKIQSARIKFIQSANAPSLQLLSAYGFNYPNNLFPTPIAQTYAVGYAGARISYNISSFYQNRNKIKALAFRESALKEQKIWLRQNISQEISALQIKYGEALNRISVNKQSIVQAKANLEITNNKYLNQLALLTDLLEADNLYEETRYNYISAQTNALQVYYRLLFAQGIL